MILEIPIQVLRSDICISSHNLMKQIHLTIALSVSDKSVNVIYFNGPRFTSIQQNTTNTGIVCMSPNFQRDSTICQYWKQTVEILLGHSHCLPLLQNSYLNDWWNHLYNGKSLLLQTYHFKLSIMDYLWKLYWFCWYRDYPWKMDLPLTFPWFSSIS